MKDWKYIMYLGIVLALFMIVKMTSPKQFDWSVTFAHDDLDPYGTYAMNKLMPGIFRDKEIINSYQTIYELRDSLTPNENLVIIAQRFIPGREDVEVLLKHIQKGGTAYISAQYFSGFFKDSLKINAGDFFFQNVSLNRDDTCALFFCNPALDTTTRYYFKSDDVHQYFNSFDSVSSTVIARNSLKQPVSVKVSIGKGNLIMNSTPMVHTNIYLLNRENHKLISNTLSYLPDKNVIWTEYYHLGRMEAESPLRFILTNQALRWAYFITISTILAFMIFEAKRKQRIIPLIKPLPNTTLQFVSTIGNLYFQHGDHKNIADKKINFFLESIRTRYYLPTNKLDLAFVKALAQKSGKPEEEIQSLFNTINYIIPATSINVEILTDLNEKIEKFNR